MRRFQPVTLMAHQADFAVIGGVRLARAFVHPGLIDEYRLLVHPVASFLVDEPSVELFG